MKYAGQINEHAVIEDDAPTQSDGERDWLGLARDAYSASTTYFDANVRRDIEEALRQFNGQHPNGSKYLSDAYRGRSRMFRPKTRSSVTKMEAVAAEALFSSYDVVNVEPVDKDGHLQAEAAIFFKALLQSQLTTSLPWFATAIGAFQEAAVCGMVCSLQSWEYNERKQRDRLSIELVPLENFRFDPGASWIDPVGTSPYLIRLIPMYVKDVRAKSVAGKWLPVSDAQIVASANKTFDSIRMAREQSRSDPTAADSAITDYTLVWVREVIAEVDDEDVIYYTLGETALLSKPAPLETVYSQGRPYVIGNVVIEAHRTYASGLPKLSRDTQSEINNLANLRMDNIQFTLNKRYFVKRNKQVDIKSLTVNMPGSATLMDDPNADVRIVETGDVTGSSFQEQDRLNVDFDEVTGAFSQGSVQTNRRLNETVGGMNLLTANANQVTGYRLRTFVETWVEPVLRQALELVRENMTNPEEISRAVMEIGLQAPDPDVVEMLFAGRVKLNVNVGMSATNPTEKVNQLLASFRAIKEVLADRELLRYGLDAGELIKEVMAGIGYRDGSRFFGLAEDPTMKALQSHIEQLQQALDAKLPPDLLQAQISKLAAETEKLVRDAVKSGVEASYNAMQAGQVIAQVPQVAPVADEIMRGAGYRDQGGQDPNFPQPDPIAVDPVDPIGPPTAGVGEMAGIETMAPDGVQ